MPTEYCSAAPIVCWKTIDRKRVVMSQLGKIANAVIVKRYYEAEKINLDKNRLAQEPGHACRENLAGEYWESRGNSYRSTPFLQVHGHEGEPCPRCGKIFCRIMVGSRGSVYCPACQKSIL